MGYVTIMAWNNRVTGCVDLFSFYMKGGEADEYIIWRAYAIRNIHSCITDLCLYYNKEVIHRKNPCELDRFRGSFNS